MQSRLQIQLLRLGLRHGHIGHLRWQLTDVLKMFAQFVAQFPELRLATIPGTITILYREKTIDISIKESGKKRCYIEKFFQSNNKVRFCQKKRTFLNISESQWNLVHLSLTHCNC